MDCSRNAQTVKLNSYTRLDFLPTVKQALSRLCSKRNFDDDVRFRSALLQRDRGYIEDALNAELRDRDVLIVGPGQLLTEALFFGVDNRVTGIDLDVIAQGFRPMDYVKILSNNGLGRVIKTLGRKALLVDRGYRTAWKKELHVDSLPKITLLQGDICTGPPVESAFDLVASWATLQCIPDPKSAVRNMIAALRPGGVLYFGVHLYTYDTGHHDVRAFSQQLDKLPPWGHLRETTKHLIRPGAYLNEWRLQQWRDLLAEQAPGHTEFLDDFKEVRQSTRMTDELREELEEFSDEELFTVDAFYRWTKP